MRKLLVTICIATLLQVGLFNLNPKEEETNNPSVIEYIVYDEQPRPWGTIPLDKALNQSNPNVNEVFNDKFLS